MEEGAREGRQENKILGWSERQPTAEQCPELGKEGHWERAAPVLRAPGWAWRGISSCWEREMLWGSQREPGGRLPEQEVPEMHPRSHGGQLRTT